MPSSPDYANRIVSETRRVLDPRVSALQAAFESLRNHLLTSIDQLAPKLDAIQCIELPKAEQIISEAMREAAWQNQVEVNLLAEFAAGIRRKETQEEILALLLDTAHQFAHGVALFVARGNEIAGWSSRGFGPDTATRLGSSAFAIAESPLLQKVLGSDGVVTVSHPPEDTQLQEIFRDEALVSWHLLPMKALQRSIAVLVACDSETRRCDLDSVRILLDLTSLCVENLALKILQELRTAEAPAPEPAVAPEISEATPAAAAPDLEPEPILSQPPPASVEVPVPMESSGQVEVEEEFRGIPFFAEPSAPVPVPAEPVPPRPAVEAVEAKVQEVESPAPPVEPVRTPSLAEFVSSTLERAEAPAPEAPAAPPPPAPASAAPPAIQAPVTPPLNAEEEKLQADARRFARLLVSEIKLYNEQRLLEARMGGQIYLRLKRDIDRSREMYEKRFPSSPSQRADHFHDEIIRILAENDPAKLGGEYPGPRVES